MKVISRRGTHARKRRRKYPVPSWVILATVISLILCGWLLHKLFASEEEPLEEETIVAEENQPQAYIGDIPLYVSLMPEEAVGRPGGEREIKYVVIHETDNFSAGSDAQAHANFLLTYGMENPHSWHYTVDDHQIYQHLPDEEPAYHAGDHMVEDGGNLNGIGIEICVGEDNDYQASVENAAMLTAYLLVAHDLTSADVQPHQYFSGKECPAQMLAEDGAGWLAFMDLVDRYYLIEVAQNITTQSVDLLQVAV